MADLTAADNIELAASVWELETPKLNAALIIVAKELKQRGENVEITEHGPLTPHLSPLRRPHEAL